MPIMSPPQPAAEVYLGPPGDFEPPSHDPAPSHINGWAPKLNPTQQKIFDDVALYILAAAEKGSGKSVGCLHSLVRHCYEENDALAIIIAPQIRTGKEGALYDLQWILDIWRNGNWADREQTHRLDEGMGLEYTQPSLDAQTKDRCIYIGNRHGGWSKVILMSIPYAEVVEKRMKDLAPSYVYVSEITELDSKEFFTYVSQQLGRRRGIVGPQQYVASCNPEGPSHWVYEVWFVDCVDAETGERDADYSVYHVPLHENRANLPDGYIERLEKLYKEDTDRERLLKGRWVDRPTGEAIFKNYFRKEIHVRGDLKKSEGLKPHRSIPVIVTYDPGPVNFSVHFEQMIPCKDKIIWILFDELNFVGQYVPDFVVVPRVLERMAYWKKFLNGDCQFLHVADEASFTHKRPDGTYDATRIQQLSKNEIRLRPCPKGRQSVPNRVQMVISMLMAQTLFISALCVKTIEMFRLLSSDKAKPGAKYDPNAGLTPKRSPYIHPFDSLSFGPYLMTMNPSTFTLHTAVVEKPMVYGARS